MSDDRSGTQERRAHPPEAAPATSARAAPMAGKLTRAGAEGPATDGHAEDGAAGHAEERPGRRGAGGADQRAGDWVMDADAMAAFGLAPDEGSEGSGGGNGGQVCALPQSAKTASTTSAEQGSRPGSPSFQTATSAVSSPSTGTSPANAAVGSAAMWNHIVGERSTAVGKLARVSAPKGVRLRTGAGGDQPDLGVMPFDELVAVERRTEHGWCWVVSTGALAGRAGFCEEQFLAIDPPEPTAHLHRVAPGETLGAIAERIYSGSIREGHDARLYVQALYEANKGGRGVYLTEVSLGRSETLVRREEEEHTLEIYRGARVREGHALWVPSEAFIEQLRAAGAITSGSSDLSKAWRGAKAAAGHAVDAAKYGAAFIVGLLEGSWNAIVDLFQGAADMIELVAKTVYQLVTNNLGAIEATLMGWVEKLKTAWANRDKVLDGFMKQWESPDAWARGNFQGEVLGWVFMTVLLIFATSGAASVVAASGKWAGVLRVLRTVDALGDITTYVGKAIRLPSKAAGFVRRKLGKGAEAVAEVAEDLAEAEGDASRAISNASEAGDAAGDAASSKRGKKGNKPAMETVTKSLDGHTFHNDLHRMSASARHVIRQLEARGWVRVAEILPEDLVEISKWFGKEIGVVQSPYGKLRVILGSTNGVATKQLKKGEVFIMHTHPVVTTLKGHFDLDIPNAGKHTEAVIDWSGQVTYFNKTGIKNAVRADGFVEPLLGYQAAFLDSLGAIIGFAKIDILKQGTKTIVKVIE
jgi:hypothetical protein